MKIIFAILIFSLSLELFPQGGEAFKIYYLSERQYKFTTENNGSTTVSLEGDKQMIDDLNRFSIYPLTVEFTTKEESSCITGSAIGENKVPVRFTFIKGQTRVVAPGSRANQKNPLNGLSVDGVYVNRNEFIPDSASISMLDKKKKEDILKTLENTQNQIQFMNNPMKTGDKVIQGSKEEIPIQGWKPVHSLTMTIFKLRDTINGIAHFDVSQEVIQDPKESNSVQINGSGYGESEYDIKNHFVINQVINSKILIRFKSDKLDVVVSITATTKQHNTIETIKK